MSVHTVEKCIEIDAGHRVPSHNGKCRNLHGHRYKVAVVCTLPDVHPDDLTDPQAGMVIDFGDIKKALQIAVEERFDHKLILWTQDPLLGGQGGETFELMLEQLGIGEQQGVVLLDRIPTAENLAEIWFYQITDELRKLRFRGNVDCVKVWETPTSLAVYRSTLSQPLSFL